MQERVLQQSDDPDIQLVCDWCGYTLWFSPRNHPGKVEKTD